MKPFSTSTHVNKDDYVPWFFKMWKHGNRFIHMTNNVMIINRGSFLGPQLLVITSY